MPPPGLASSHLIFFAVALEYVPFFALALEYFAVYTPALGVFVLTSISQLRWKAHQM